VTWRALLGRLITGRLFAIGIKQPLTLVEHKRIAWGDEIPRFYRTQHGSPKKQHKNVLRYRRKEQAS